MMQEAGGTMQDARGKMKLVSISLIGLLLSACAAPNPAPLEAPPTIASATTARVVSTSAPSPTPTVTPMPQPQLMQLTTDGCCVNPGWSPDSKQVLFIDKPTADAEVGYYAIDVSKPSSAPEFIGRVGLYSPDRTLAAFAEGSRTVVERLSSGESWIMPNNGHAVEFAPNNRRVAWEIEAISGAYDERPNDIYVADFEGKNTERVTRVYGGGLIGWLPNSTGLMFLGRPSLDTHDRTLTVLDLKNNTAADLVTAERIAGVSPSNGGAWVAYFISFNEDETRNGLWVQRTDGGDARKLDVWGAYQWRDDAHLLLIPMRDSGEKPFEVWEIDAASGQGRQLTEAAATPLTILNGDWRVSPDGKSIVFVNSVDRNLWVLKLP
jgi:Tol biopolymer transport system component